MSDKDKGMTLNISSYGQTRSVTDVEVVEEAFRDIGCDPSVFDPTFIPFWVQQGKSVGQIIAISGETPRRAQRRTA